MKDPLKRGKPRGLEVEKFALSSWLTGAFPVKLLKNREELQRPQQD